MHLAGGARVGREDGGLLSRQGFMLGKARRSHGPCAGPGLQCTAEGVPGRQGGPHCPAYLTPAAPWAAGRPGAGPSGPGRRAAWRRPRASAPAAGPTHAVRPWTRSRPGDRHRRTCRVGRRRRRWSPAAPPPAPPPWTAAAAAACPSHPSQAIGEGVEHALSLLATRWGVSFSGHARPAVVDPLTRSGVSTNSSSSNTLSCVLRAVTIGARPDPSQAGPARPIVPALLSPPRLKPSFHHCLVGATVIDGTSAVRGDGTPPNSRSQRRTACAPLARDLREPWELRRLQAGPWAAGRAICSCEIHMEGQRSG